jgi:uncharacterized Zn finger protein
MNREQIESLAGPAAFRRGIDYHAQGRITLTKTTRSGLEATAQGTQRYRLWLREEGDLIEFDCSCPAAADGSFCKHLVAASLAWMPAEADDRRPEPADDDLQAALLKEPRERLADWLFQAAMADDRLDKQLRLKLSSDSVTLKKSLSALLRPRGFLDWRRSTDYAMQLDAPLDILESLLERDPDACLDLADYAVKRLLRIYQRADDSRGAIGDRLRDFAHLHARAAARASITGPQLATRLFKFKELEDWNLFPLERYWDSLGSKGQAAYLRRVDKAVSGIPVACESDDFSAQMEASQVLRWREEIARSQGDFDTLIELLSRDLSSGYGYEKIVKVCREFGQDALALSWAERGLKHHPDWRGMRPMLAEEYQRAGLDAEAQELLWQDFRHRPGTETWERLKTGNADQWPTIRQQALEEIARREVRLDDGRNDVSLRLQLLMSEGALDEALDLAMAHAAGPSLLVRLAKNVTREHPQAAASLYRRAADAELPGANANTYRNLVPLLKAVAQLNDCEETRDWLAQIRTRYKARRKLMGMMDKAGL